MDAAEALTITGSWRSEVRPALAAGALALAMSLLGDARAALLAGLFVALDPTLLELHFRPLTETLFAFLLLLAAFLWQLLKPLGWTVAACALGLTLSMAALTRPIGLYLGPLLAAAAMAAGGRAWRRPALALAVSSMLLPSLWCARNLSVTGRWTYSQIQGLTVLNRASALEAHAGGEHFGDRYARDARGILSLGAVAAGRGICGG